MEDTPIENVEDGNTFDVELTKNSQGLGITIAGYIGDKTSGMVRINSAWKINSFFSQHQSPFAFGWVSPDV